MKNLQLLSVKHAQLYMANVYVIPECHSGNEVSLNIVVREAELSKTQPSGVAAATIAGGRKKDLERFR